MVLEVVTLALTYFSLTSFFNPTIPQDAILSMPIPEGQFVESGLTYSTAAPTTGISFSPPISPTAEPLTLLEPTPSQKNALTTSVVQSDQEEHSPNGVATIVIPTPTSTQINIETTPSIPSPTPTSLPTPTQVPLSAPAPNDLDEIFERFSSEYSVDKELLKHIAKCESSYNTNAQNGDYTGMFQFAGQTWSSIRSSMGLDPSPDLRTNAEESIRTAAAMIAKGQQNAWRNCL